MRQRALGGRQLHRADLHEGRQGRKGVNLDFRGGGEQRRERHPEVPRETDVKTDVMSIYIYLSSVKFIRKRKTENARQIPKPDRSASS